jgi:hypothetical protein
MTPQLVSIDGGVVQTEQTGFVYNGESNLDIGYAQALVGKQNITLYQVGDPIQGASFNNFLFVSSTTAPLPSNDLLILATQSTAPTAHSKAVITLTTMLSIRTNTEDWARTTRRRTVGPRRRQTSLALATAIMRSTSLLLTCNDNAKNMPSLA